MVDDEIGEPVDPSVWAGLPISRWLPEDCEAGIYLGYCQTHDRSFKECHEALAKERDEA